MDSEEAELPDPDPLPVGGVGVRYDCSTRFINHLRAIRVRLYGVLKAYHHLRNLSLHYLMTNRWPLATDMNIERKGL